MQRVSYKRACMLGLFGGWIIGMIWWICLMIAFGPSIVVTLENGQPVEKRIAVTNRILYAPVVALPWALAGALVCITSHYFRSSLISPVAALGAVVGGSAVLIAQPFNGWLALVMPVGCFFGSLVGLLLGIMHHYSIRGRMRGASNDAE